MRAIAVKDVSQVAEARRTAVLVAKAVGFGEEDAGRVAIVATELATNLIKHGGGGELLVGSYSDRTGNGVECLALDKGPGIGDFEAASRDGYSTAGSQGSGLGAIARNSHQVDVFAPMGSGTAILVRFREGRPVPGLVSSMPRVGAINLPKTGEDVCGDAWSRVTHARGYKLVVADGLGHGTYAADASQAALRVFQDEKASAPGQILQKMHLALRPTRGAAISVADVDIERHQVTFAGIGNVAGVIVNQDGSVRQMVSHNGTVGHVAKRVQEFIYQFAGEPLIILCSDGLATNWNLRAYPGLAFRHPTLIAGVLYRDFTRGRDDVTVVVTRGEAA
ncbi:ATP-binding SpoIIE family protein phosphatase [Acidisoma silvae]|uniref:SpoIIE family protein phosphatase n=1 Tax=Acidisoma silvae TaxID=2802396 RepID=A0A963YQ40_9PROT|nr:ATP-binding SpoIIE family protein phosphatase [Acidisoma silvae]MCB8874235.1 SpoIIE family protein phosphatase [Acidisoma silvae]